MFENSEKLFIFLVIALLFLGPSKMAGLGTTIGRAIRDFRSAVRGAQETFSEEFSAGTLESPASLPVPNPVSDPAASSPQDIAPTPRSAGEAPEVPAGTAESPPASPAVEVDDQSSLASEPSAQALAEHRTWADHERRG